MSDKFQPGDEVRVKDGTSRATTNRVGHGAKVLPGGELVWDDGITTGLGHYERTGLLELVTGPQGKFKPGDRVRTPGGCNNLVQGQTYTIQRRNDYPGSGVEDDGVEGYTIVGDRQGLAPELRRHPAGELELVKTSFTDEELTAMASQETERLLEEAHEQASQYAAEEAYQETEMLKGVQVSTTSDGDLEVSYTADDGWWDAKPGTPPLGLTESYLEQLGLEVRVQLRRRA